MHAFGALSRYLQTTKLEAFNGCLVTTSILVFLLVVGPTSLSMATEGLTASRQTDHAGRGGTQATAITLLGQKIRSRQKQRLTWNTEHSFDGGNDMSTPVLVVNGAFAGPTVCLTAAVHGDEINGIEMVRSIVHTLTPETLSGTVIGVPIVNISGFRRNSRYLPDRRDLNRYFPGKPNGTLAARIAYSFFSSVVRRCDYLVDLHTGSFHRTNLPQIRANMKIPEVKRLAQSLGDIVILHSKGLKNSLRRAATQAGIPSVAIEAGEPMRLNYDSVNLGVKGIRMLLSKLDMIEPVDSTSNANPVYYRSKWVRTDRGGILLTQVKLGAYVNDGDRLGVVIDPITNERSYLTACHDGKILGMALNQVVMPGYAALRIGIEKHPIAKSMGSQSNQLIAHQPKQGGRRNNSPGE